MRFFFLSRSKYKSKNSRLGKRRGKKRRNEKRQLSSVRKERKASCKTWRPIEQLCRSAKRGSIRVEERVESRLSSWRGTERSTLLGLDRLDNKFVVLSNLSLSFRPSLRPSPSSATFFRPRVNDITVLIYQMQLGCMTHPPRSSKAAIGEPERRPWSCRDDETSHWPRRKEKLRLDFRPGSISVKFLIRKELRMWQLYFVKI